MTKMKKIIQMINTAPTKSMATEMLEAFRIYGNITEAEYTKGRKLIKEEFQN